MIQKSTSNLKQIISTVYSGEACIQMSRRKFGNEANALIGLLIWVIELYNNF